MKKSNKILVVLTLSFLSIGVRAQAFWGSTAYGDSVSQVQAKVVSTDKPLDLSLQEGPSYPALESLRAQGVTTLLRAEAVIEGVPFELTFTFKSSGLDSVRLAKEIPTNNKATEKLLIKITRSLHARYENPVVRELESGETSLFYANGKTLILLTYGSIDKNNKFFISYSLDDVALSISEARRSSSSARKWNSL